MLFRSLAAGFFATGFEAGLAIFLAAGFLTSFLPQILPRNATIFPPLNCDYALKGLSNRPARIPILSPI